jgi:hypothetical protein
MKQSQLTTLWSSDCRYAVGTQQIGLRHPSWSPHRLDRRRIDPHRHRASSMPSACPSVRCTALTFAPVLTARLAAAWRRSCGVFDGNDSSYFWHAFTAGSKHRARQFELRNTPPRRSVKTRSSRPLPACARLLDRAQKAGTVRSGVTRPAKVIALAVGLAWAAQQPGVPSDSMARLLSTAMHGLAVPL